jgi:hypothetical protein
VLTLALTPEAALAHESVKSLIVTTVLHAVTRHRRERVSAAHRRDDVEVDVVVVDVERHAVRATITCALSLRVDACTLGVNQRSACIGRVDWAAGVVVLVLTAMAVVVVAALRAAIRLATSDVGATGRLLRLLRLQRCCQQCGRDKLLSIIAFYTTTTSQTRSVRVITSS